MNFFEAQDKARRNTLWLVLLFVLAVVALVALTNLFLLSLLTYVKTSQVVVSPEIIYDHYSWREFAVVSAGLCLLIFSGSLYKTISLSGGGATVAEMLGGQLVPQASGDLHKRQLLNVVEEMAIAAGMPIPQVYLLNEGSINAFAAGRSPADAVIGITDGALKKLNREELQGVIAHEFSHIANGDMRLNIRLIGVLHGILLLGMIGYFILRSLRYGRRSRSSKGGGGIVAVAALGFGLLVIGYAGTFCGQWIKAIVSRQREYLADSSAVQFTRNRDGIAGALKKIGGNAGLGSYLDSPAAPQYSHAYFADGISRFWQSLFATHPPLEKRIRRIEPRWDGEFLGAEILQPVATETAPEQTPGVKGFAVAAAVLTSAEQAISQVGTLNEENIEYVHRLILEMPPSLRQASQDAYSARAVVYAALVGVQKNRDAAMEAMSRYADPGMRELAVQYLPELKSLNDRHRLPLLELAANALRELSPNQFVQFKMAVQEIIRSDKTVSLGEWVVQRFLLQQLDRHFGFRKPARAKYSKLEALGEEVAILLSLVARIEHRDADEARSAFDSGVRQSGLQGLEPVSAEGFRLDRLDRALDRLTQLKPLAKPRFLKACVAVVLEDGKTTTRGVELVRTISTCLDCPMPPMRAG